MLENNIKISIIVPVYNVKDYIRKSIDSYLNQDFDNYEIILVDDGSNDGSEFICDEYKEKFKNIIVIHQKNSGAHNARNAALKIANGKYICFFDADDYVEKNMLKELYQIAEKNELDLVISGFFIDTYYNNNDYITLKYIPSISVENSIEVVKDKNKFRELAVLNFDNNMFYSPWNKIYKKSYLDKNHITFPITYRDDFPFVLSVIKDIEKVAFTKECFYHFIRKRSDSETQKFVKYLYEKREEEHGYMKNLFDYWNVSNDEVALEVISRRYVDRVIECMVNLFSENANYTNSERVNYIKQMLQNDNLSISLKYAKPNKLYLKIMYIPLKFRNVSLCCIMSNFIHNVKKKNVKVFSLLKKNR